MQLAPLRWIQFPTFIARISIIDLSDGVIWILWKQVWKKRSKDQDLLAWELFEADVNWLACSLQIFFVHNIK